MNVITNTIAIDVITVFTKCGSFFVLIGTFRGDTEAFAEISKQKPRRQRRSGRLCHFIHTAESAVPLRSTFWESESVHFGVFAM